MADHIEKSIIVRGILSWPRIGGDNGFLPPLTNDLTSNRDGQKTCTIGTETLNREAHRVVLQI
jgi:hypothetical protein